MSSSHQYLKNSNSVAVTRLGEIEHLSQLSENLSMLCLNPEYSDVTLIVEGQRLHAHKVMGLMFGACFLSLLSVQVILAARSEYFRALLYGGMKESSQVNLSK